MAMPMRSAEWSDQNVARSACDSQSTRSPRKPNSDTSMRAITAESAEEAAIIGQNGRV
jgi:hypothetical protein